MWNAVVVKVVVVRWWETWNFCACSRGVVQRLDRNSSPRAHTKEFQGISDHVEGWSNTYRLKMGVVAEGAVVDGSRKVEGFG